jgi:hypothetical protein
MSSDDASRWLAQRGFRTRLTARALEDDAFRRELLADPQATIERECSLLAGREVRLPDDLRVEVHQESSRVFHLVIPEALVRDENGNDMLVFWERILRPPE